MNDARPVDAALLDAWAPWIGDAVTRFASSGFGAGAQSLSPEAVHAAANGDVLHSAAVERGGARGLLVVSHGRWEEKAVGRPFAKIAFVAADTYDVARGLLEDAVRASAAAGVVLLSYRTWNAPTYMHVAAADAGFHPASEALVLQANMDVVAPLAARIPLRGTFRAARPEDADAIAEIGRRGFTQARYTSDPHFPAEWGSMIYAEWARQLVVGAADAVVVAEHRDRLVGFTSMSLDHANRAPGLLAVEPEYDGRGIGVMLARCFFDWYRERGVAALTLRTEKNNIAVNALYLSLGLTIVDAEITYHATPA